jgi:DNA repair photolyase
MQDGAGESNQNPEQPPQSAAAGKAARSGAPEKQQHRDKVAGNGRGTSLNPHNRFHRQERVREEPEGLDEWTDAPAPTQFLTERARSIVNEVKSPDVGMAFSANPYQGCEHGCAYCYARPTHAYWGYSPGLDFERTILVKEDAPWLLEQKLRQPNWEPKPIVLSGNTDCYQPAERKFRLTRAMLEVFLRYRHPVGIITKNSLILRDLDLYRELSQLNLVRIFLSITTLRESLRRRLEPRTASGARRLEAMAQLAGAGVPVNLMLAPVIPGLNAEEIPAILQKASEAGAQAASMQLVRLNGEVAEIFEAWLRQHYPDRADKVLAQIRQTHGGTLADSRFGLRMTGEGPLAQSIRALFVQSRRRYFPPRDIPPLATHLFVRAQGRQLGLF